MNAKNNIKIDKVVFFLAFFLFSGYYIFLALIIKFNLIEYSRYYSIPIRVLQFVFMSYLIYKGSLIKSNYLYLMLVFSALYIIKVLYTAYFVTDQSFLSRNWYEYILYYLSFCYIPFLAFGSFSFKKYHQIIIKSIILSGFLFAIAIIYLYQDLLSQGIGRLSMAQYTNEGYKDVISPLSLSYGSALTISLCFYRFIYDKFINNKVKLYLGLVIIVSFVIFFLGSSRGAVLALFTSILVLFYFSNLKNKLKFILVIIISIPLVSLGIEKSGSSIMERVNETIAGKSGISARGTLYEEAIYEFVDHPIFGGKIEVSGIYPHNILIEILMATGVIGLLLFLPIVYQCFIKGFRLIKHDRAHLIAVIILINGFVLYMFSGSLYGAIMLFTPMGMIFSSTVIRKRDLKT
jgi:hypothetical protein